MSISPLIHTKRLFRNCSHGRNQSLTRNLWTVYHIARYQLTSLRRVSSTGRVCGAHGEPIKEVREQSLQRGPGGKPNAFCIITTCREVGQLVLKSAFCRTQNFVERLGSTVPLASSAISSWRLFVAFFLHYHCDQIRFIDREQSFALSDRQQGRYSLFWSRPGVRIATNQPRRGYRGFPGSSLENF